MANGRTSPSEQLRTQGRRERLLQEEQRRAVEQFEAQRREEQLQAEAERLQAIEQAKIEQEKIKREIAQSNKLRDLINRVASGKPLPSGTSLGEQREIEKIIEKNPEVRKAIEKADSRSILESNIAQGRLKGKSPSVTIEELGPQKITDLKRLGLVQEGKPIEVKPLTTGGGQFIGPVRTGYSVQNFRTTGTARRLFSGPSRVDYTPLSFKETGESRRAYRGPTRLGVDVQRYRDTGELSGVVLWDRSDIKPKDAGFINPDIVKTGFDWVTDKIVYVSRKTSDFIQDKTGGKKDSFLFKDRPTATPVIKDLISTGLMFQAFSPFMKTGTSQRLESQYTYDVKKGRFIKKKDLIDYLSAEKRGNVVKVLGKGSGDYNLKAEKLRFLLSRAKEGKQGEILKLAREVYGSSFVKDFLNQEGNRFLGTILPKTATTLKPSPSISPSGTLTFPKPPEMRFIGLVGGGTKTGSSLFFKTPSVYSGTGQYEKIQFGRTGSDTKTDTETKTDAGVFTSTKQGTSQESSPQLNLLQKSAQDSLTKQDSRTKQAIITKQTTKQTQTKMNLLRRVFRWPSLRQFRRTPIKRTPRKPTLFDGVEQKKKRAVSSKQKQQGYIVQAKERGRWKTLLREALSKRQARNLGALTIDRTTSAQMRILKSSKKPVKIPTMEFQSQKFRNYKIVKGKKRTLNPSGLIEKKKYRIDTPSEKKELSVAKFLKSQEFKKRTKRKRKKRKGSGRSLFFG